MSLASYLLPPALGLGLSLHGLRRRSLSPPGAATAFLLGTLTLSSPLRTFGSSLLLFYLLGSRATKLGAARKRALEEGGGVGEGRRGVAQVLVGGGVGLVASVLWAAWFGGGRWPWGLLEGAVRALGGEQRAFGLGEWNPLGERLSRALIYLSLGHFATSLGDTLASELGILSRTPPVLITTLRPVPPGTNGGVSALGTGASLLGGLVMGCIYAAGLALESAACVRAEGWGLLRVVAWGGVAGGVGSLLDSLLGATLQQTVYNEQSRRVVTDEGAAQGKETKVISGLPVLSNIQVNFLTSALTGGLLAWLAA